MARSSADSPAGGHGRARSVAARGVLLGACIALAALLPRVGLDARMPVADGSGFTSRDPDSLYQMRRLARFFEEGWPALQHDPYLDHPHGSSVPWPVGYALVQAALLGPGLPEAPAAARRHVEQGVASLPLLFGVLAAAVLAWCGMRLAGPAAGAAAGLYVALCGMPIESSRWGNGDHHAFVLLLVTSWTLVVTGAGRAPRWRSAAAAGLLCGWALISWVPSVFLIATGVLTAFAMLLAGPPDAAGAPRSSVARWWLVHWSVALALVAPFAATSPWTADRPWDPAYLTLIQPAALALAGLVPATYLGLARGAGGTARARRGLVVWAAVIAAGTLAFPLARHVLPAGLGDATSVLLRADRWHDVISESQPLLGPAAHPRGATGLLGLGFWLAPVALVVVARTAWRERDAAAAGVLALAVVTGGAALLQARFADLFAVPLSLLLALMLQRVLAALARRADVGIGASALAAAGLLTVALLQAPTLARTLERTARSEDAGAATSRRVLEWLAAQGAAAPPGAVLSMWGQGHAILWAAGRPVVASNFGPFAGREGFEVPLRFYLERDPAAAEALLAERDVAYVIVRSRAPTMVFDQVRMLGREDDGDLVSVDARGVARLLPAWNETMAGRLHAFASDASALPAASPAEPPAFLRLVHASPRGGGGQACWLFERVRGATVRVRARPGETLHATLAVRDDAGGPARAFAATATADAQGLAVLRVPYATGGQGSVRAGPCFVSGETSRREVLVPEAAVVDGGTLEVDLRGS